MCFKAQLFHSIAGVLTLAMFVLGCEDRYERVGDEVPALVYPQGVAQDFTLTYTESIKELTSQDSSNTRVIAVLKSPLSEDYTNLRFPYQKFPNGIRVEYFDANGNKSIILADYAIIYAGSNLYDLKGNVTLLSHDGKVLKTNQLYWDRERDWIFTEGKFALKNPEDGTMLNGQGLDFNRDFTYFKALKTGGEMLVKEES
jgi:LPS export ABC transporter protein LptC